MSNLIILSIIAYVIMSIYMIRAFSYVHCLVGDDYYEYSIASIFMGLIFPISLIYLMIRK